MILALMEYILNLLPMDLFQEIVAFQYEVFSAAVYSTLHQCSAAAGCKAHTRSLEACFDSAIIQSIITAPTSEEIHLN